MADNTKREIWTNTKCETKEDLELDIDLTLSFYETNCMLGEAPADNADVDPELEAIRLREREMEEETEKLRQLQIEVNKQMNLCSPPESPLNKSLEEKIEADNRSIFVGNVDYAATVGELEQHFYGCGSVKKVTILCNKFDGHPKGFAYIEFGDKDAVQTAMALNESLFRGRQIKVMPKRTNRPGISTTNRPPRGKGAFRWLRGTSRYVGVYRSMRWTRSCRRGGHSAPY